MSTAAPERAAAEAAVARLLAQEDALRERVEGERAPVRDATLRMHRIIKQALAEAGVERAWVPVPFGAAEGARMLASIEAKERVQPMSRTLVATAVEGALRPEALAAAASGWGAAKKQDVVAGAVAAGEREEEEDTKKRTLHAGAAPAAKRARKARDDGAAGAAGAEDDAPAADALTCLVRALVAAAVERATKRDEPDLVLVPRVRPQAGVPVLDVKDTREIELAAAMQQAASEVRKELAAVRKELRAAEARALACGALTESREVLLRGEMRIMERTEHRVPPRLPVARSHGLWSDAAAAALKACGIEPDAPASALCALDDARLEALRARLLPEAASAFEARQKAGERVEVRFVLRRPGDRRSAHDAPWGSAPAAHSTDAPWEDADPEYD